MTDKEKILAKIELLLNETNYEPFTDEIFGRIQTLKELKSYIYSLQEEPKIPQVFDEGYWERLGEEPVSEELEEALAREWKGYNDRGASTVDALEDNTQELAFAKGFYRGVNWQKEKDQETIELAEDHAMLAGMEKMKEQMMEKAIDARCFGFQGAALFSFKLPADNYLVGSEVKVIVIKED